MEIAVIKSGASQYVVQVGKIVCVNKINKKVGETLVFDNLLEKNKIQAEIIEHNKAKKVRVFKFHNKTGYKKTQGHRQDYTKIKIIALNDKKAPKEQIKEKAVKPVVKKSVPKKTKENE